MLTRGPLVAAFLLISTPLAAHTVPSMQNGSFDHGLLPWAVASEALPAFEWALTEDANGSAASRAVEIGIRPDSSATRTFLYQCIQIDESRVYEAGVRAFLPPDQRADDVSARLAVRWYADRECSGDHLPRFLPVASVTRPGTWTEVRLPRLTPAPGATHAAFSIEITRTSAAVPRARARFDDAYFAAVEGRLIVPAVASLPGAGGSVWSSELYVVNPGEVPVQATLLYRCNGRCSLKPRQLTVPARESIFLPNVAADFSSRLIPAERSRSFTMPAKADWSRSRDSTAVRKCGRCARATSPERASWPAFATAANSGRTSASTTPSTHPPAWSCSSS